LLDNTIHQYRLEVLDRVDRAVVSVIELLSPTNKVAGSIGRQSFLQKRNEVYATSANWMEIDLLREGMRTANLAATGDAEYQVFLSKPGQPRRNYVWPIFLKGRLPKIGIPLLEGERDVPIDLQDALTHVYESGGYDLDLDYRKGPIPPLYGERLEWAREIVAASRRP
jgi:hypothetical protein